MPQDKREGSSAAPSGYGADQNHAAGGTCDSGLLLRNLHFFKMIMQRILGFDNYGNWISIPQQQPRIAGQGRQMPTAYSNYVLNLGCKRSRYT